MVEGQADSFKGLDSADSLSSTPPGIDEDDLTTDEPSSAPLADMPPLEGEDDTSRMEEVD